jgi:hypothetical protein
MTTYTIHFSTDAEFASHDIEADTPEQALALAQQLWNYNQEELWFEPKVGIAMNEIAVLGPDGRVVAVWYDDELRLRLAASDLLEALELAVAALNTAPRFRVPHRDTDSYRIAVICDRAIAKAKGGAA